MVFLLVMGEMPCVFCFCLVGASFAVCLAECFCLKGAFQKQLSGTIFFVLGHFWLVCFVQCSFGPTCLYHWLFSSQELPKKNSVLVRSCFFSSGRVFPETFFGNKLWLLVHVVGLCCLVPFCPFYTIGSFVSPDIAKQFIVRSAFFESFFF